ncbi:hypothetical protein [Legionella maceachernii]|uniref:hypothetical protein n=1 Tax=Legionella maceachernii TaxID=466 RepID=UPI001056BF5C|nr:hypothetical protein [Legionella maceachernii]
MKSNWSLSNVSDFPGQDQFNDLIDACNRYIAHLEQDIGRYFKVLKAKSGLQEDWGCDVIISKANSGLSLTWSVGCTSEHSITLCPELYLAIKKHNLVSALLMELNNPQISPEHKLQGVNGLLSEEKKKILKEPYSQSLKSKLFKTKGEAFLKETVKICRRIHAILESENQSESAPS